MDPSEHKSAGSSRKPPPSSSKRNPQRKEPRPTDPPKVSQESHKIKKPAPIPSTPAGTQDHHAPPVNTQQQQAPSVTNDYSDADFKDLAQPLTTLPSPGDVILPPAQPSGYFLPDRVTSPIRGSLLTAFYSSMDPIQMPDSSPFNDALWSPIRSPKNFPPVTETVPFGDVLPNQSLGSLSSAMVSSPPVTETVPITTVPNLSSGSLSCDTGSSPPPPPPSPPISPTEDLPECSSKPFYPKNK